MSRTRKICIVTSSYPTEEYPMSGAMIPYYAEAFQKKGLEVHVFFPDKNQHPLPAQGVRLHPFRIGQPVSFVFAHVNPLHPAQLIQAVRTVTGGREALLKYCLENKIDHCLACWAIPAGFWCSYVKQRAGIPFSVWSLGSDIHTWSHYPLIRQVIISVLKNADLLFADGMSLADEMRKLSGKKSEFLPTTTGLTKRMKPQKRILEKGKFRFLYSGRWEKVKGTDVLIRAIALFLKTHSAEFHLLGSGGLHKKLTHDIMNHEGSTHVHIHGVVPRNKLEQLMSEADCLVIPSRNESIPYVLSEGAKKGLPLIVTDVGDMGKLLRSYPDAGIVVPAGSPEKLSQAFKEMMTGKKPPRRGNKGIGKLASLFDISRSVAFFLSRVRSLR